MEFREFSIEKLSQLSASLIKILDDLNDRVIPKQESDNVYWDYIRAEIWEDSGRVIFFPASSKNQDRIDLRANFIFCKELHERVEELCASDLPDEEYDAIVTQMINSIADQVISFFYEQQYFKLRCFDQDGNEVKT